MVAVIHGRLRMAILKRNVGIACWRYVSGVGRIDLLGNTV